MEKWRYAPCLAALSAILLTACQPGLPPDSRVDSDTGINGTTTNYIATQYWTWYTPGKDAPMWEGVSDYGQPSAGWYDSHDPTVAACHIDAMLGNGINVLSYAYVNKAGDGTMWYADIIDPDQAFRDGAMRAPNFGDIKFFVSYDLATRAMLVHNAENGLQWGHPEGMDVLPWVKFDDPGMRTNGYPSFDFNVRDANGFHIYEELLMHDFRNFAENYFTKSNYFRVNGQCVVFIYNSWRFNNGGVGDVTDGFSRALQRVRADIYDWYGTKLYLAGDFVSFNNKSQAADYRTKGYYKWYDAVHGWNVFDDPYRARYGEWSSLSQYSDVSKAVQDAFRPQAGFAYRSYRSSLPEPARTAYGSSQAKVDYIPLLSFSFRRHDGSNGFKSGTVDTGELTKELDMVRTQRSDSRLAEEDATIVYNVAFNQWNEGQLIEPTIPDANDPYPGKAGWSCLGMINAILGPGW